MKARLDTGEIIDLGDNEVLVEKYRCPKCGGQLVTNYGPGLEVDICTQCGHNEYDYTGFEDDF